MENKMRCGILNIGMTGCSFKGFALGLLMVLVHMEADAQNLHFSQFFHSPLTANPANTGFIPDADYRVGANYRNKVINPPSSYQTMSAWLDGQLLRGKFESGWLGVGTVMLRDVAGIGRLTTTKMYASTAYHQMLGTTGLLSVGFGLGFVNKRVDQSKFEFDSQWDNQFFNGSIPSGESFSNVNIFYLDFQAGINYAWFPTDNIYIHGGISAMQLNRPKETFFDPIPPGYDPYMDRRYTAFVDAMVKLNDRWILSPSGYYQRQSLASELTVGMHANHNLGMDGEKQLLLGFYYRVSDAVIPMFGFQWKTSKIMFSYDANHSTQIQNLHRQGAMEVSLLQSGFYPKNHKGRRQAFCPNF